jgi:hypothetical protein
VRPFLVAWSIILSRARADKRKIRFSADKWRSFDERRPAFFPFFVGKTNVFQEKGPMGN